MKVSMAMGFFLLVSVLFLPHLTMKDVSSWNFVYYFIFFTVIVFVYYYLMKTTIVSKNIEEMEVASEGLLRLFISKTTAFFLALSVVFSSAYFVYEAISKQVITITIKGVSYPMDRLIGLSVILFVLICLEETSQVYLNSTKGIRDFKKKS